jgi:phosphonopyruvate decarboxylase
MLEARDFVEAARARGFQWYAGVPCSYLTPFINYVLQDPRLHYVSMANEGDAVALAAGVTLAGDGRGGAGRGVVMMQNSGLGNAVSPLTSLTWTFGLPQLLIVTWRGQPGVPDEPQHALMGPITPTLLETMQIAWELFPTAAGQLVPVLERALAHMSATGRPYALLMQKGSVASTELHVVPPAVVAQDPAVAVLVRRSAAAPQLRPSRAEALREMVARTPERDTVLLASTGFCGRELYAVADRANHLYMVGSMGCVTPLALGLALARPDLKVIALDGDGAALMRLGALATVGASAPRNLWHLLLDNSAHESTGGQATVSATVAFAAVAAACGYRSCLDTDAVTQLAAWLELSSEGPHFARLLTRTGTPRDLPRPKVTPAQVRERFMQHISAGGRS